MTDERANQQPTRFRILWGDDFFASRGPLPLPAAFIEFAHQLGLEPAQSWLVCCLCYWRWTPGPVWPSLSTLSEVVGRSEQQIRRYLQDLEEKGLVTITPHHDKRGRQTTNDIDFAPLIKKVNELGRLGLPGWAHGHEFEA